MWRAGLVASACVVLVACGEGPDQAQRDATEAAAASQDAALLDSAQAPLDRARGVQDTVDEHAAKLDARARAAAGETAAAPDAGAEPDDAKGRGD